MHIGHVSSSSGLGASQGAVGRTSFEHAGGLSGGAATHGAAGQGLREQALGRQQGQGGEAATTSRGLQGSGLAHEQGTDPAFHQMQEQALGQALGQVHAHAARQGVRLEFSLHRESGQLQVAVLDQDSGKLLRKIPEDEFLELAQRIAEYGGGPLLARSL